LASSRCSDWTDLSRDPTLIQRDPTLIRHDPTVIRRDPKVAEVGRCQRRMCLARWTLVRGWWTSTAPAPIPASPPASTHKLGAAPNWAAQVPLISPAAVAIISTSTRCSGGSGPSTALSQLESKRTSTWYDARSHPCVAAVRCEFHKSDAGLAWRTDVVEGAWTGHRPRRPHALVAPPRFFVSGMLSIRGRSVRPIDSEEAHGPRWDTSDSGCIKTSSVYSSGAWTYCRQRPRQELH
jgi:hypothetical protein